MFLEMELGASCHLNAFTHERIYSPSACQNGLENTFSLFKLNNIPWEVLETPCNFSFLQWEGFAEPGEKRNSETTTATHYDDEKT